MVLLHSDERPAAAAIGQLAFCNPFLTERIELERTALGPAFVDLGSVWHRSEAFEPPNTNVVRLAERAKALAEEARRRLLAGASPEGEDLDLYRDLVFYRLYQKYERHLLDLAQGDPVQRVHFADEFQRDLGHFLALPQVPSSHRLDPSHLLALSFQVRRAFDRCFHDILGGSMPAARLRATVWQSIFTHDMRRYARTLFGRMGEIATLVTGPSGTGKELVAKAIGLCRYIPFDPATLRFEVRPRDTFHAVNLTALSPALVESELFGHRKGTFTGAVADREGWLEQCLPCGTLFLDEIGEVDLSIQVKLLRVLQTRAFQRIGETRDRRFLGKVVAATNRDLRAELERGAFREDLYYRLCSDQVETPSLAEQLRDAGDELARLVGLLAEKLAGPEEAERLTEETLDWIHRGLPADYAWPGNVRELEQCVRNVLVRGEYRPSGRPRGAEQSLGDDFVGGRTDADTMLARYCTLVYAQTGSYVEAARRLGLDRRTVKARVDEGLLKRLRSRQGS
ncbi:MAG: sigma 54-interacting transcriptional regulator [Acidobacteriota bacterium]